MQASLTNIQTLNQYANTQVQTLTIPANASVILKNRIFNPSMAIDQRNEGQAQTITSNATFFGPDRMAAVINTGTTGFSYDLQQRKFLTSDIVAIRGGVACCRLQVNTTFVGFGSTSNDVFLRHSIEGMYMSDLFWGTAAASSIQFTVWVKSNVTGTHSIAFQNATATQSYVYSFSIASADRWQKVSFTVPGPTTGTWFTNNNAGVVISIDSTCEAQKTENTGSWTSGNFTCPSTYNSTLWRTVGNYVEFTQMVFEKGTFETAFEYRLSQIEHKLCQRYCEKSFPLAVHPANNTQSSSPGVIVYLQGQYGAGQIYFKTSKRATPSVTLYNPWASSGLAYNTKTGNSSSTVTIQAPSITGFSIGSIDVLLQNAPVSINYVADAEL